MKAFLLIAAMLVGGVAQATPPIHDDTNKILDDQCNRVASFARSIATLKESGITETDLVQYISQPTVQTFPITLIRHQVYAENMRPTVAYQAYYTRCLVVGYSNLLQSMKDADELDNLRSENRLLKSQLAMAQERASSLNRAIETQRTVVVEKLVPSYGTPIEDRK